MLKTESDRTILGAVTQMIEETEKNSKTDLGLREAVKARQYLTLSKTIIRSGILNDLLDGIKNLTEYEPDFLKDVGIELSPRRPVLLMVSYHERETAEALDALEILLEDAKPSDIRYNTALKDRRYLVWFFQLAGDTDCEDGGDGAGAVWIAAASRLKSVLDHIQAEFYSLTGFPVSFAIGEHPCGWAETGRQYAKLRKTLNLYPMKKSGVIISADKSAGLDYEGIYPVDSSRADAPQSAGKAQRLYACLEQGDRGGFFAVLDQICGRMKGCKSMHDMPAIEAYYTAAVQLIAYVNAYQMWEKAAFHFAANKLSRYDEHQTWGEAFDYLRNAANILFDLRENERQTKFDDTIVRLKKYIEQNLSDDMTVYSLGEAMHFNPAYLSRVFMQATGVHLSQYIIDMRVEKAKELLRKQDVKIADAAKMAGFSSANYFSRLFKKTTGYTPQQFRDSIRRGAEST